MAFLYFIYLSNLFIELFAKLKCCGLSQSRHKHGKKDACGLYDWIVYKRGSKAKEKERKRQAVM